MAEVSPLVWAVTILGLVCVVIVDLVVIARRRREVTVQAATGWVVCYVTLAGCFAVALLFVGSAAGSGAFLAGYVTEYSLSVDNLFVFMLIMSRFRVPALARDKALYVGIITSLVLRGACIMAGAAAIAAASWVFYVLGAFLLYTAVRLPFEDQDADFSDGWISRTLRRVLPVTDEYDGRRLYVRSGAGTRLTPLFVVVALVGVANVVFALDSIPAIFGLTRDAYIVFTANAFALLGLRQLYFLVGGLMARIRHLDAGLAVILGFIGVKLVLEALRGSGLSHLAGVPVPAIGTLPSLGFIVGTLGVTVTVSLLHERRDGTRRSSAPRTACPEPVVRRER